MFGCSRKRRGFTLVELLIVIIIIGILAGVMMLAAGSATDKAEATKVVNNLRVLKTAAIAQFGERGSWSAVLAFQGTTSGFYNEDLAAYLIETYTGTTLPESERYAYSVRSNTSNDVIARCVLSNLYSGAKLTSVEKALVAMSKNGMPLYGGAEGKVVYSKAVAADLARVSLCISRK